MINTLDRNFNTFKKMSQYHHNHPIIFVILFILTFTRVESSDESMWNSYIRQTFGDGDIPEHWNWVPHFGSDGSESQLVQTVVLNPEDTKDDSAPPVMQIKSVYELKSELPGTDDDKADATNALGQALRSIISYPTNDDTANIIHSPQIAPNVDTTPPETSKTSVILTVGNRPYIQLPGSNLILANTNQNVQVVDGGVPSMQLPGSPIIIANPISPVPPTTVAPTSTVTAKPTVNPTTIAPTSTVATKATTASVTTRDNPCNTCIYENGFGFVADDKDCTKFRKCYKLPFGGIKYHTYQCPFGLYWNNRILSCDFPRNTQCLHHPCKNTTAKYTGMSEGCAGYWRCDTVPPVSLCCPPGKKFHPISQGCIAGDTCTDTCQGPKPSAQVCDKTPVFGSKVSYRHKVGAFRWKKMDCPLSTGFNRATCGCTDRIRVSKRRWYKECQPQLQISFTNGVFDESRNKYYITNKGVTTKYGSGIFDGKSKLLVNRFANSPFGKDLTIELSFEASDGSREQVLISNGDCGIRPSLLITTGPDGVTFSITTSRPTRTTKLTVPINKKSGFIPVKLTLSNNRLSGEVNGVRKSRYASGSIVVKKSSLVVGSATGFPKFRGTMDYVKMYLCQKDGKETK